MNTPLSGLTYLLDGFKLIQAPGLRRYVILPLLINFIIFIALFFLLRHYFGEFNTYLAMKLPDWLFFIKFILWILFVITFFILFIYAFVTVANIIAAPFNSLLSEKVELYLSGKLPPEQSIWQSIKDAPRSFLRQISILGYYLPRAALILLLFILPVVNAVAAFLWFAFNAWYMAFTYLDYPADRHRISVPNLRASLKARKWLAFGFGGSVLLFSMIPFLNFFTIPAAVAGATKLWVEERFSTNYQ